MYFNNSLLYNRQAELFIIKSYDLQYLYYSYFTHKKTEGLDGLDG